MSRLLGSLGSQVGSYTALPAMSRCMSQVAAYITSIDSPGACPAIGQQHTDPACRRSFMPVNPCADAAGSQRPRLQLRLERVQCRGMARCAWRLWLSPQQPPLLLLLYRTNLKVEGVTQVLPQQLIMLADAHASHLSI